MPFKILGKRLEGRATPGTVVGVISGQLRPASCVVDENVAADAIEAEIDVGAHQHPHSQVASIQKLSICPPW